MKFYYSSERNTQVLIALMKYHGIKKVIASPGATNVCFVGSLQQDPFFEIYSAVDERSAAYMACGLAAESGEPVALSCTGATASRNYVPGLTEAFYRKLPVLAVTSTQSIAKIGNHLAQVIDRSSHMKDLVKLSIQVPAVYTDEELHFTEVNINKALLELRRHGGNPVHLNLQTVYSKDFGVKELPEVHPIDRITSNDAFPEIANGNVGIYVGAHAAFDMETQESIDRFCEQNNAVVFCDQTSNYRGKYRVLPGIVCGQAGYNSPLKKMNIMIHIGEISGAYMPMCPDEVWRVSPDGEVRDTFGTLRYVFEMTEKNFFDSYLAENEKRYNISYYEAWKKECGRFLIKEYELPFSNIWAAKNTAPLIPAGSAVYFGILNTLRSWNFTETPKTIIGYSNTGGFGIDGALSTILGASMYHSRKLYFCFLGDLGFFYDMNAIGNRHVGKNIRIMVINNGKGTEFRNYGHHAAQFGEEADQFMAAAGHFGSKSKVLIKHYAQDLGFEYMSASSKEEFMEAINRFTEKSITDKPMLFEVFTDSESESKALEITYNLETPAKARAKNLVKEVLGEKGVYKVKEMLGKNDR